jgi:hypothetical protein
VWKDLFLRYSLDNPRYSLQNQQQPVKFFIPEDYREMLMRDQLDLNRSLVELLKRSEEVMGKIRQSEAEIAAKITLEEEKKEEPNH